MYKYYEKRINNVPSKTNESLNISSLYSMTKLICFDVLINYTNHFYNFEILSKFQGGTTGFYYTNKGSSSDYVDFIILTFHKR